MTLLWIGLYYWSGVAGCLVAREALQVINKSIWPGHRTPLTIGGSFGIALLAWLSPAAWLAAAIWWLFVFFDSDLGPAWFHRIWARPLLPQRRK